MSTILPQGMTQEAFAAGLQAFAGVVAEGGITKSENVLKEYRDPCAFAADDAFMPSAVLLPTSVDQIRAIVSIANKHAIPLWTLSQGRNLGYGGGAPRVRGSVVVSLRSMNRVIEVNEE